MKSARTLMKAVVPALALVGALSLPPVAEAGHRHGPGCGHRGHKSGKYYSGHHHHRARHHAPAYRHRPYPPAPYGHGYGYGYVYRPAPPPYAYAPGPAYGPHYGYYPPPPYGGRPRVGVSLYLGF